MEDHLERSPTISNQGSMENDQAMNDQPENGNVDDQQPQQDNVDEQQPANNDAALNPDLNQQGPPNQIANVPDGLVAQPQQQLPVNIPNPRINRPPQNGLFYLPPHIMPIPPSSIPRVRIPIPPGVVMYKTPHFHFRFGDIYWTFNDFSQRIPTNEYQSSPHPIVPLNVCRQLPMRPFQLPSKNLITQNNQLMANPPPLVSRIEIEPGIFEEFYSHRTPTNSTIMLKSPRCTCLDFVGCSSENEEMITIIINTPNLSKRYSMTIHQETPFSNLFNAYYGFNWGSPNIIFVANGKRLNEDDSPESIGMKTRQNIYTFVKCKRNQKIN